MSQLDEALDLFKQQFKGKPKITALATAILAQFDEIETANQDLLNKLQLSTGADAVLDALGVIVGQPRNGASDTDYKRMLGARIAANRSTGKIDDIIRVARAIVNDATVTLNISYLSSAVLVRTGETMLSAATAKLLLDFLQITVIAGVRVLVQHNASSDATSFQFAKSAHVTVAVGIAATSITVGDASMLPASGSVYIDYGAVVQELISYTNRTATQLLGVTGVASAHAVGAAIQTNIGKGWDNNTGTVGGAFASVIG